MALLEVEGINSYYGESHIIKDLSLIVTEGEIVALIGRNGAGKTTTLRSIMGLTPPRSGGIKFSGQIINGLQPST
jgi:branched-chain amino acid transport system ATP-binding protein